MAAIKRFNGREGGKNLYLSISLAAGDTGRCQLDDLNAVIGQHVTSSDLRRFDERGSGLDATYLLDISSTGNLTPLSNALRARFPDVTITFLDQNGMPGI
jgi:hypothetical protein